LFRKYFYHIVFHVKNNNGAGIGRITLMTNKKIKTSDDVEEIRKHIENNYNIESVVILNWIRLKS
jgi:hypothetical protein